MRLEIEIASDNEVFESDSAIRYEVYRLLKSVADKFRNDRIVLPPMNIVPLHDINGNKIGKVSFMK